MSTHRIGDEDDTFPVHPDQLQELIHVVHARIPLSAAYGNLRASTVVEQTVGRGLRESWPLDSLGKRYQ